MALFLEKYVKKTLTPTDRERVETAWLTRWKEHLGNPSRLPRKVMKTYLEHMDITSDTLDDQMDWDCWPEGDVLECDVDVSEETVANAPHVSF